MHRVVAGARRNLAVCGVVAVILLAGCASDDVPALDADDEVATSVEAPETITEPGEVEAEPDAAASSVAVDEATDEGERAPTKGVTTRSPDAVGDGNPPQDVGTAIIRITDADGNTCDVCMWLADGPAERSTGLMGVHDLGQPVGMAFLWDGPTSGNFFMFNTPTPLSIAWFGPDGSYLSEADMAPCITDDSSTCERYGAGGEYDLAIEMFQGELDKAGIGPGARAEIVQLADPATPTICPLRS